VLRLTKIYVCAGFSKFSSCCSLLLSARQSAFRLIRRGSTLARASASPVEAGARGVHYLDFCKDYRLCPFSVVAFSYDMKKVGDVRQLAGKIIEIRGEVKEYDGRAEIILENAGQLGGEAGALTPLPPLPKNFDVEQRGRFSARKFRPSHSRNSRKKKGHPTLPAEIPEDVESD
jgi:hypothetical protein